VALFYYFRKISYDKVYRNPDPGIVCIYGGCQDITGKWKSVDDNSGQPRSIVEITESGGKIYGKVIRLFPQQGEDPDPVCDKCDPSDPRFKKKVIGMEIIRGLFQKRQEYSGGDILDPENGKVYRSKLWLEGKT